LCTPFGGIAGCISEIAAVMQQVVMQIDIHRTNTGASAAQ
jgi:hypothetical protein